MSDTLKLAEAIEHSKAFAIECDACGKSTLDGHTPFEMAEHILFDHVAKAGAFEVTYTVLDWK